MTMTHAIVRIFDVFEDAEGARKALLAEGFTADQVQLTIANDEAGPTKGNFWVGNSSDKDLDHTYERNYADIEQAGQFVMTVDADDAEAATRAGAILGRFRARAHPAA